MQILTALFSYVQMDYQTTGYDRKYFKIWFNFPSWFFFFFFAFPKLTIYWGKTVLLNLFPYLKYNASHDNSEL